MNARTLDTAAKIMLIIGIATLISTQVSGQEADAALTAEEIVARHEASWVKLEKLAIQGNSKQTVHSWVMNQDDAGKDVHYEFLTVDVYDVLVHVRGLDQFIASKQVHPDFPNLPEQKRWRIDGVETKLESQTRVDILHERFSSPSEAMRFGRTLNRGVSLPPKLLGNWVKEAKPDVSVVTNDQGESCWRLHGKFRTRFQLDGNSAVNQIEDLTLTLNEKRGCLIERMEFAAPSGAQLPSATWIVTGWLEPEVGVHFPAKMRFESTASKAKTIPTDDGKRWSEFEVTSVDLKPKNLDAQFKVVIPTGALVNDLTERPGSIRVAIWGDHDKPQRTFATRDEYAAFAKEQQTQVTLSFLKDSAQELFPNCMVEAKYDASSDVHHIFVRDPHGTLIREFQSEDELRVCAYVQFHLAFLLGKETRTR